MTFFSRKGGALFHANSFDVQQRTLFNGESETYSVANAEGRKYG